MRKIVFTLFAASTMMIANTATDAEASAPVTSTKTESSYTVEAPKQASAGTAVSETFTTKYYSNVRQDAGLNNKVLTVAKKGATVKATEKKVVGSTSWYKVSANGHTGWVSSTVLTSGAAKASTTAAAAPAPKAEAKASKTTQVSNSTASASGIVQTGLSLLGTPYSFGGTTPAGFDCSGFVQYVFNQNGKSISRSTLTQFAETTTVTNPRPGDLVFFANTYRAGISHVGIYIGDNKFVHSGGAKAEVRSVDGAYWKDHFHSFKRK